MLCTWRYFMLHRIFGLAEWHSNILKSQYRSKLYLTKCSNCNIQINHNASVISSLYDMLTVTLLGIASCHEGISGLKPAQACCTFWNYSSSCSVFTRCVGLSHVFAPPMLVWLTQGGIHTLLMNSETFLSPVIHSTVDSCLSKTKGLVDFKLW